MVRTVALYGASDDLVEVEDAAGTLTEEYSASSGTWVGVLTDTVNGDTAYVYVRYEGSGCWTATLGIYEEGYNLPEWNPRTVLQHGYATALLLDLPDSVSLEEVTK